MAVTRRTQKDVGRFEAKLIGPFTTHQTIFAVIGIVLCLLVKFLCDSIGLDTVVTVVLMLVVGGICIALGFLKPLGMTSIEYCSLMIETQFLNPGKRPYKSTTDIDCLEVVTDEVQINHKGGKNNKTQPKQHHKLKDFPEYL